MSVVYLGPRGQSKVEPDLEPEPSAIMIDRLEYCEPKMPPIPSDRSALWIITMMNECIECVRPIRNGKGQTRHPETILRCDEVRRVESSRVELRARQKDKAKAENIKIKRDKGIIERNKKKKGGRSSKKQGRQSTNPPAAMDSKLEFDASHRA